MNRPDHRQPELLKKQLLELHSGILARIAGGAGIHTVSQVYLERLSYLLLNAATCIERQAREIEGAGVDARLVAIAPPAWVEDHGPTHLSWQADTVVGRFVYGRDNQGLNYWQSPDGEKDAPTLEEALAAAEAAHRRKVAELVGRPFPVLPHDRDRLVDAALLGEYFDYEPEMYPNGEKAFLVDIRRNTPEHVVSAEAIADRVAALFVEMPPKSDSAPSTIP